MVTVFFLGCHPPELAVERRCVSPELRRTTNDVESENRGKERRISLNLGKKAELGGVGSCLEEEGDFWS